MIQFKLSKPPRGDERLYEDYCRFIFSEIRKAVENLADPLKYKVRSPDVLESSVIRWIGDPPDFIDLRSYVIRSLEMVRIKGEYIVRVSESQRVYGARTKVSTLVRLLEYGNEKVLAYPVITRVLQYYQKKYPYLLNEYFKKKVTNKSERLSLRRGSRRAIKKTDRR